MQTNYAVPYSRQMPGSLPVSGRVCNGKGNRMLGRMEASATIPAVRSRSVKPPYAERSLSTVSHCHHSHSPPSCMHRNPLPCGALQKKDRNDLLVEVLDRISLLLAKVNGPDGGCSNDAGYAQTPSGETPVQERKARCPSCGSNPSQTVTCATPSVKARVVLDVSQNSACASLTSDEKLHMQQRKGGASDQRPSETNGLAQPPGDFASAPQSSEARGSSLRSLQMIRIRPKTCPSCTVEATERGRQIATHSESSTTGSSPSYLCQQPISSRLPPQCFTPHDHSRVSRLEVGLHKALVQALQVVQAEAEHTKRLLDDCREQLAAREDALNRKVLCQAAAANHRKASPCCAQKVTCHDSATLRRATLIGNRARQQATLLQLATRQLEEEIKTLKKRMATLSTRLTHQNTVIADRETQLKKAEKQLNRERQVSSRLRRFYMQTSHRNKHLVSENNALEETLLDLELKLCRPQTLWALAQRGPRSPGCMSSLIHRQRGSEREPTAVDALAQALLKEKEKTQRMQANLDEQTERLLMDIARRSHTQCPISQQRRGRDASLRSGLGVEEDVSDFRVCRHGRPWQSACVESTSKRVSHSTDSACPSARSDGGDKHRRKSCLKRAVADLCQKDSEKMIQPLEEQHICNSFRSSCNSKPSRRSLSCDRNIRSCVNPLESTADLSQPRFRGSTGCGTDDGEPDPESADGEFCLSGRGLASPSKRTSSGSSEVQMSIRTPRNVIHACATVTPANTSAVPVNECCEEEELSEADFQKSCGPPSAQSACVSDSEPCCRLRPTGSCCSRTRSPLADLSGNNGELSLDDERPCCALPVKELGPVCSSLTSISSSDDSACPCPTLLYERGTHEPRLASSGDACRPLSVQVPPQQPSAAGNTSRLLQTSRPLSPAARTPSPIFRANSSQGQRLQISSPEAERLGGKRQEGDSGTGLRAPQQCTMHCSQNSMWSNSRQDSLSPSWRTHPSTLGHRTTGSPHCCPRPSNPLPFPSRIGAPLQSSAIVSSCSTLGSSLPSVDSSSIERDPGGTDQPSVSNSSISCVGSCCCCHHTHEHRCCGVRPGPCRPGFCEPSGCHAAVSSLAANRLDRPCRGAPRHNSSCCCCTLPRTNGGPVLGSTSWGSQNSSGQASLSSEPSSSLCGNDTAAQLMSCACPDLLSCPVPSQRCNRKERNALEGCVSWALPPQVQLSFESET
uniref:Uncharacterized protein n=1 Tax=Toxoplasma gondii (strain ATCC 50861 / VEG) TaxID=432359 RepID=A0A0F7V7I3_TOXGV|nr:TPA: hypothetical protein BN1205_050875 [Toxoplasma gondii VEG]